MNSLTLLLASCITAAILTTINLSHAVITKASDAEQVGLVLVLGFLIWLAIAAALELINEIRSEPEDDE